MYEILTKYHEHRLFWFLLFYYLIKFSEMSICVAAFVRNKNAQFLLLLFSGSEGCSNSDISEEGRGPRILESREEFFIIVF